MSGRFQIFMRRRQNQFEGTDVVVQCNPDTGYAEYIPGVVDNTWIDFTNYIEGAEKLSFTWDKVNSGNSLNSETNQDGSNYDKGITSDLMFFDAAYQFIYDHLLSSECDILNAVEVKIVDLIAGNTYRIFELKNDNIDYAPVDEPCQFHIKLREQDGVWHCVHKTFIWDNWQRWFENSTVKEHPCFLTCIEPRPRLLSSVRMSLLLLYHSVSTLTLGAIGFIVNLFIGEDIRKEARKILNANRFVDAPLVRTYIENVAGKCNLAMDTIFDDGQPWENLCLYYPQAGYMHESDENDIISPSLAYHFDNRWLITIAELFDKLKVVFAAEWYVTPNNTIVFKHTKDLIDLLPIYDFTAVDAATIYDLRYTFNGTKKPAYGRYEYTVDGSDMASQEMSTLYNDIIDYDGPANNPMLEGEKTKNFEFAPTGFIRDGRAKDYLALLISDGRKGALLLMVLIGIVIVSQFSGGLTVIAAAALVVLAGAMIININANRDTLNDEFVGNPAYTGAVRITSEQVMSPRLILWDGISMERARAVATITLPAPNTFYNPDSVPYNVKNRIDQDNVTQAVYNYPLYFDGDFQGNLFDSYHDVIDNPLKSKESHQDVKWNVDLCVDMLNLFGVFENQYAVIGKVVKLEERNNYDVYARISNIGVDYDNNKINLKGTVLRRGIIRNNPAPPPPVSCITFQINVECLVINEQYISLN
jgi:hypothetical protein